MSKTDFQDGGCGSNLGFQIDTILAHFNSKVVLLLQSKFWLKSTKGLGRNVCVQVLWPSQPNEVMSSAVSLPNHSFTGQALSSKRLTSIVYSLSIRDICISRRDTCFYD